MTAVVDALMSCPDPLRRRDAPAWGLSPRAMDRLAASGQLVQVVRGVFLRPWQVDDLEARALAVGLALPPGAAVCRRTAGWLWGVDPRGPSEQHVVLPVECFVPEGSAIRRGRGVTGFVTDLRPDDVTLVRGVPCTTAHRTAIDLARWLQPHMGLACLDALAAKGTIDPERLLVEVERWRGRRHVDRARRLISLCEPKTESFGESWVRLRVVDAGFPRPEPQIWIVDDDGVAIYRLDMGWRERRIGLEYDGEEFHGAVEDAKADEVRRDDLASRFGWDVIGVDRGAVLGRSMALELAVGDMLGILPTLTRRQW